MSPASYPSLMCALSMIIQLYTTRTWTISTILLPYADFTSLNSAKLGNTDVLEHILSHDECDVDPLNRLDKQTPLHLACQIEQDDMRKFVV